MTERITEADLKYLHRESRYPNVEYAVRDIIRLVAEVRRLRGLIVRVLPLEGAPVHYAPELVGAAELRGQIVRDLVAEAEAIRAEAAPKSEPAPKLVDVGMCLRTEQRHRWIDVTPMAADRVREYRCADCGQTRLEPLD